MSFGPDIKELLKDVGTPYVIFNDVDNISGEFLLYKTNNQATKPFIREFFVECKIAYSSQVFAGATIQFNDGRVFLVVNDTPRQFEGQTFDRDAVLYKCNVSGELLRFSGEVYGDDYRTTQVWDVIRESMYGTITEEMYGNYLDQDSPTGQNENRAKLLYLAASVGIKPLDRYVAISGEEVYKVEEVDKFSFTGVHVAHLEIDTRG